MAADHPINPNMATPTRRCSHCRITKPLTDFHRNRNAPDGCNNQCRLCVQEGNKRRAIANTARAKTWYAENKERARASGRQYFQTHKQEFKAYKDKTREKQRAAGRQAYARRREYYKMKARAYGQLNSAKVVARVKEWNLANPEKARSNRVRSQARRRSRKFGCVITRVDLAAIKKRDKMICHICKKRVKLADLSFDHLIPLSKGGPHAPWNLAVAHLDCNRRKATKAAPAQPPLF